MPVLWVPGPMPWSLRRHDNRGEHPKGIKAPLLHTGARCLGRRDGANIAARRRSHMQGRAHMQEPDAVEWAAAAETRTP